MSHKISKKQDELYSELFGKDAKGENVEVDNKYQPDINAANQPFALKVSNSVFKIIDAIFTTVVPVCLILVQVFLNTGFTDDFNKINIFTFVFTKNFIFTLFVIIGYILSVKAVIWVANILVNFIIIAIYSVILNKIVKQTEKVTEVVKDKLSKMDDADKEKQEREKYNGYTEKEIVDHAKELVKKREDELKEANNPDIELIKRDI